MNRYTIQDIKEGQTWSLSITVTAADVDAFAKLSGDVSPLHMQDGFACSRGFQSRVVHGVLLLSYVSQMVGVHIPGENALLQTMSVKFISPCYIGDTIEIVGAVVQIALSVNSVILDINVTHAKSEHKILTARVQVGFTRDKYEQGRSS